MSTPGSDWIETNQQQLMAAIGEVRAALEHGAAGLAPADPGGEAGDQAAGLPSALQSMCAAFGLSRFERAILLMCAGVELDGRFASLCAGAHGDAAQAFPSFSLALACLPEPHWSAVTPVAPLRRWRLIECETAPGTSLLTSRLRLDERVLHFLTGIQYLDERIAGLLEPVGTDQLVSTQQSAAREIAAIWAEAAAQTPLIQLCGADPATRRAIAAAAGSAHSLRLYALAAELDAFLRLWEREATLSAAALCVETDAIDRGDGKTMAQVTRLLEAVRGAAILSAPERWRPLRRPTISIDAKKPTIEEQRGVWQSLLAETPVLANGQINALVSQFRLTAPAIRASLHEALAASDDQPLETRLWKACRSQARLRLEDLAQRIEPVAVWHDLVLPPADKALLREL